MPEDNYLSQNEHNTFSDDEGLFRAMVENIPGVVYRCEIDPPWEMQYISSGVEKLTGIQSRDFAKSKLKWSLVIHPDDEKMVEDIVRSAVLNNRAFEMEYRIIHRDGSIILGF